MVPMGGIIMKDIRLIALDLDGTLLNSEKILTPRSVQVLAAAAAQGAAVVPATGRFYRGMPEALRALPFLRYAITINGAQVYDAAQDAVLARAELPLAQALEAMRWLDGQDVIYDCYVDNWGWITREFQENAAAFVPDRHYLRMLQVLRTPVPELKAHLAAQGKDVQKIIIFTRTDDLQAELLELLPRQFPGLLVTSSAPHNIEINTPGANKGAALLSLAAALGIPRDATMAIGDGLNDLSMLRAAGLGVAMGNAHPQVLKAADAVTADCDHDGAAEAICAALGLSL